MAYEAGLLNPCWAMTSTRSSNLLYSEGNVAQLVVQRNHNPLVVGSNPSIATRYWSVVKSGLTHMSDTHAFDSSSLSTPTILFSINCEVNKEKQLLYNVFMKSFKEFQNDCKVVESILKKNGNAYSLSRHLSKMIEFNPNTMMASSNNIIDEAIDLKFGDRSKGGIILFSLEVNANEQSKNKLIDFLKKKFKTFKNKLAYRSKIDKIAQKHDLVGWTIGKYLDGRYFSKETNKQYSEDSLSLEIIGIRPEEMIEIAEELCKEFDQESVLLKDYSTGDVMLVKAD